MRSRAKSTPPGSPPHLRGKPLLSLLFSSILRITPAPAGKTKQWILHRLKHRDHPRTCGENLHGEIVEIVAQGSPPHLRGKRYLIYYRHSHGGITPAPAGKTKLLQRIYGGEGDHPRTCGENCHMVKLSQCSQGSPPHLRGKH